MRGYQVFGSLTAIVFAILLFFSLGSNPPIHVGWTRSIEELKPLDFNIIGRAIGQYLWENLYIALLALILVAIALAISVSVLLRGE
ncbi:MAG: hypothetical protein NZ929_00025 [Aigarchaeota archaeon]|nr:hypothetical protein [Aigarchaeota archaeon]